MHEPESAPTDPATLPPPPPPRPAIPLPPPPGPPLTSGSALSASGDADPLAWWRKVLGGLGWFITFVAIYSTTELVVRLVFEALGIDTTVTGATGGLRDEKNPVGQVVAILAAIAVGALGTFLLRRWYHAVPTPAASAPKDPEPGADLDAEPAR